MFSFFKKKKIRAELKAALADGILTDLELSNLEKRADELKISNLEIALLRHKDFETRIAPIFKKIKETRRFSPQDEEEIKNLEKNFQVKGQYSKDFDICRALWEYETNGKLDLQPITVSLLLQKSEKCFFEADASWQQEKVIRKHNGYVGANIGFRVTKGVRFSVGRAVPIYSEHNEMKEVSKGKLYITNKKILFNGSQKSTNITMGRIIELGYFSDGVEIRKTSGKPDFFALNSAQGEYFSAIVHKIINS